MVAQAAQVRPVVALAASVVMVAQAAQVRPVAVLAASVEMVVQAEPQAPVAQVAMVVQAELVVLTPSETASSHRNEQLPYVPSTTALVVPRHVFA